MLPIHAQNAFNLLNRQFALRHYISPIALILTNQCPEDENLYVQNETVIS